MFAVSRKGISKYVTVVRRVEPQTTATTQVNQVAPTNKKNF